MRLRERQAAQTRELILETALGLFADQGYDATTMEQIAAHAGIGTSTLYRYFTTKDALVTEPLALRGQMAAELRTRPSDEPLDVALGHALRAFLSTPRADVVRLRQILEIVESAAGPRTRIAEDFQRERMLLTEAVAERVGRVVDDVFCQMTARIAMSVLEVVGSMDAPGEDADVGAVADGALRAAEDVMRRLRLEPPAFPTTRHEESSSPRTPRTAT